MAKLTGNTVLTDPTGTPVVLLAGDEVPDWATDLVGDHLTGAKPHAGAKAKPSASAGGTSGS